jgi:hypothetical protein
VRVLLDESVPRALGRELVGHDWSTVPRMGWSGLVNGVLLGVVVDAGFEVLLTCDRNLQKQQNVSALGLALVVIAVPDTKIQTIQSLVPDILAVLDSHPHPCRRPRRACRQK